MTRILSVGLVAAGLATAGFAQTPVPATPAQPAPTGTVTGTGAVQTNPTGVTGTAPGTGLVPVPTTLVQPGVTSGAVYGVVTGNCGVGANSILQSYPGNYSGYSYPVYNTQKRGLFRR